MTSTAMRGLERDKAYLVEKIHELISKNIELSLKLDCASVRISELESRLTGMKQEWRLVNGEHVLVLGDEEQVKEAQRIRQYSTYWKEAIIQSRHVLTTKWEELEDSAYRKICKERCPDGCGKGVPFHSDIWQHVMECSDGEVYFDCKAKPEEYIEEQSSAIANLRDKLTEAEQDVKDLKADLHHTADCEDAALNRIAGLDIKAKAQAAEIANLTLQLQEERLRKDILADRHWIAGAKFGWNVAMSADEKSGIDELHRSIEHRLGAIREARAAAKEGN